VTILSVLASHASACAHKPAFVFLEHGEDVTDSIAYGQLLQAVDAAAQELAMHCEIKDRVLLALPDGIDFVVMFLACLRADLVAVPVKPPQNRESARKIKAIAENCDATAVVCSDEMWGRLSRFGAESEWMTDMRHVALKKWNSRPLGKDSVEWPILRPEALAYLQYTSGSTGKPKGVMVSHANVLANQEMIRLRWGSSAQDTLLSWLPMFHDMGLIAAVLHAIYLGATCVLMPPIAFVQKPSRWMQAAARFGVHITGGPNFALRLISSARARAACEGVDLASLRVVYCGSEPIAPSVVRDFLASYQPLGLDPRAFSAGYGMAEATLMVSAGGIGAEAVFAELPMEGRPRLKTEACGRSDAQRTVVSCGQSLQGQRVRIVDPQTAQALEEGCVGEIWLHGPHIGQGYWANEQATREIFQAQVSGEEDARYLRTGDLGFMLGEELFVTGRMKELMVFNGVNHYPQDVEESIVGCHSAISLGRCVAFSSWKNEQESLVLVQEINRDPARNMSHALALEIIDALKSSVYSDHGVAASEVVLVRLNSIPRTTSGKICRVSSRKMYEAQALELVQITQDTGIAEAA
jgi:acyl-CoA synthetase (AMP-forming)/AMP-acid ligase II